jgi:nucleoid-associated protein YgaU
MLMSKALLVVRDATPPLALPVMFNPPEYQLTKTNEYAEMAVPGVGSSVLQYVKGNAQTLAMSLFFDSSDTGIDVRSYTSLVEGLTAVRPQSHRPPRLLFVWGSLVFPCVLEAVSSRFLRFDRAGLPLRAELAVSMRGDDSLQRLLASVPLQSSDKVKGWVVAAGDRLESIAAQEYGDPRAWRDVARANGIDNPLRLVPGQRLTLPTR